MLGDSACSFVFLHFIATSGCALAYQAATKTDGH